MSHFMHDHLRKIHVCVCGSFLGICELLLEIVHPCSEVSAGPWWVFVQLSGKKSVTSNMI